MNTIVNCPYFKISKCPCQVCVTSDKITSLSVDSPHTPADHAEDKFCLKFLTPKHKKLISTAVRIAPHQTARDLIRNVQESPTKQIDNALKQCVQRKIRRQRSKLNKVTLGGVELDSSLGTSRQVTDVFWFGTALERHRAGSCLDMFQTYVIGRQFEADDRMVVITFATAFNSSTRNSDAGGARAGLPFLRHAALEPTVLGQLPLADSGGGRSHRHSDLLR